MILQCDFLWGKGENASHWLKTIHFIMILEKKKVWHFLWHRGSFLKHALKVLRLDFKCCFSQSTLSFHPPELSTFTCCQELTLRDTTGQDGAIILLDSGLSLVWESPSLSPLSVKLPWLSGKRSGLESDTIWWRDLGQGLANSDLWINPACHLLLPHSWAKNTFYKKSKDVQSVSDENYMKFTLWCLYIRFYWNTAMPIHWCFPMTALVLQEQSCIVIQRLKATKAKMLTI